MSTGALLSSEIHTELGGILQNLTSSDNQARTQAEGRLKDDWFVKQPDVLLMGLAEQIQLSQEPSVRFAQLSLPNACINC